MHQLTDSMLSHKEQTHAHAFSKRHLGRAFTGSVALAGLLFLGSAAHAQDAQSPQARYKADRAACMKNSPSQDHEACLREAGAALQEAQKAGGVAKKPSSVKSQDYAANRTRRCDALPMSDREDCIRRIEGEGVVEGSVETGGVLRTLKRPVAPLTTP